MLHSGTHFATRSAPHSLPRLAICLASHPGPRHPKTLQVPNTKTNLGDSQVTDPGALRSRPRSHLRRQPAFPTPSTPEALHCPFPCLPARPSPNPRSGGVASERPCHLTVTDPSSLLPQPLPAALRGAAHLGVKPACQWSPVRTAPPADAPQRIRASVGLGGASRQASAGSPRRSSCQRRRGDRLAPQHRGGGGRLAPPRARHSPEVSARGMGTGAGPPEEARGAAEGAPRLPPGAPR